MSPTKTNNKKPNRSSNYRRGDYMKRYISNHDSNHESIKSDVKIFETKASYHYELEMPGYIKDDFYFYINGNDELVVTTGKRYKNIELGQVDDTNKKHSYCYPSAYVKIKFQLPRNIIRDEILVDYKDEILSFDLLKFRY